MNVRSLIFPGLACIALPVSALDLILEERQPSIFPEDQLVEFMERHTLEVRARAVMFDNKQKKSYSLNENDRVFEKKNPDRGATALGLQFNFKSGWLMDDSVGFDASVYTVGDLHSPHEKTRDLLLSTSNGPTGFSKLGQAYIKARIREGDEPPLLMFKGGRERIYTGLISGSGSRSAPSSWEGIDIGGGFMGLSYGFAWVDKVSRRNSSNFEELKSFRKKNTAEGTSLDGANSTTHFRDAEKIDSVWGVEFSYDLNGLSLGYRDSHSKDFLFSYSLDAEYTFDITNSIDVTLNGKYYKEKEDGKLWTGYVWGNPAFSKDANIRHFNISIGCENASLLLGYTKTEASYRDSGGSSRLGAYYYDFGMNTYGGFDIPTSMQIGDFIYDNEKAWVIGAGYDFQKAIPGLTADFFYTRGNGFQDGKNGEKLKESEYNLDIKYSFQEPSLNGLSLRLKYAHYKPDGLKANNTNFAKETTELRTYIDYKAMVF